jgi:hypothetical protein
MAGNGENYMARIFVNLFFSFIIAGVIKLKWTCSEDGVGEEMDAKF